MSSWADSYQVPIDNPNDIDMRYLAGFFDGEGCVVSGILSHKYKCGITRSMFAIQIRVTKKEECEMFAERFGGNVREIDMSVSTGHEDHHKQVWTWSPSGRSALTALEQLQPYLRGKKKEAELAIEAIKLGAGSLGNKQTTRQEAERRLEIARELQRLKQEETVNA